MTTPEAEAVEVQGWRPIASAPKDGTRVLCYSPIDGVVTSHFEGGIWQGLPWRRASDRDAALPTHWQPLPTPPKEADRD